MRHVFRRSRLMLLFIASVCVGCGEKFDDEKTYQIEPGNAEYLMVDAPRSNQKVTVTTESGGAPIDVYLVLAASSVVAEEAIAKKTPGVLASQVKTANPKLEATVSAGKEYTVVVKNSGTKKVNVKLKVAGR